MVSELAALARDLGQVRDSAVEDSTTVQVLSALSKIAEEKRHGGFFQSEDAVTLTPTELTSLVKAKLAWEKLSTRELAGLLNPLGLYSKQTRGEARGRRYHLSKETLEELTNRYAEQPPERDEQAKEA